MSGSGVVHNPRMGCACEACRDAWSAMFATQAERTLEHNARVARLVEAGPPRTDFADREPAPIPPNITTADLGSAGAAIEAEASRREFAVLRARAETSAAQRDAALDTVAALLDILERQGGYMEHRDQVTLRSAEALLVEHSYAKEPTPPRRASQRLEEGAGR